jgi:hypothetical protein
MQISIILNTIHCPEVGNHGEKEELKEEKREEQWKAPFSFLPLLSL